MRRVPAPLDYGTDNGDEAGNYDYQNAKAKKEHWNAQRAELM